MTEGQHYIKIQQTLANNIKSVRKAKDLTQDALAGKSGLALRHLQKIEAAEVNVTLSTIAKLAKALEVTPHSLFLSDKTN